MSTPLRDDWDESLVDSLCGSEMWDVEIRPTEALIQHMSRRVEGGGAIPGRISESDQARLIPKLAMVKEIAAGLAGAMLKGTLKYPPETDTALSLGEWWEELRSDATDALNYTYLLRGRMMAIAMGTALATQKAGEDPERNRGFVEELGVDFDALQATIKGISEVSDLPGVPGGDSDSAGEVPDPTT